MSAPVGCTFEEFIQQRGMPYAPFLPPMPPPPQTMRPLPPGLPPTNQGALQQSHPPVGSKPPVINGNHGFSHERLGPPVTHGNSWSPWSNDLDFLGPPTTSHTTTNSSSLKQIWSQPDHTGLDALQNSFGTLSLDPPTSRSHDSWEMPLPPSNSTKWSDNWSDDPSAGMNGFTTSNYSNQRSPSYYNRSSGYLTRPVPNGSALLARGNNSDMKPLSRPRSALYHPLHVKFNSVANIPRELLQSVCSCFSHRQRVCQTCFLSTSPTNETDLFKISRQNGPCYNCGQSVLPIVVMPTSPLCVNMGMFIPILPCPANATCINCCPNTTTCHDQQCCYAHSVEELVIWCVELESG